MNKLFVIVLIFMMSLPFYGQDESVDAIPACNADELTWIPGLLIDSGFLLDYALVSFGPIGDDGTIDYLPSMTEMLAVRDVWIEAIAPNLPNCVQSIELQMLMGDFLDQALIQMMTSTIHDRIDESYAERADIEQARLETFDIALNMMFETLFADIDIEAALREQMEAREGN